MRTIAIGDIHGCSKALHGLIAEIKPQADDCLVFLGDYIDRGPDSRGVIEALLDVRERCNTKFLLGNHEVMLLGALRGLPADLWLKTGGQQTVTSYGGRLENISELHRDFLRSCLHYYETETHIFVHANYKADLPMDQQTEASLFWDHLTDYVPEPHVSGKHVVLGHTPQNRGEVGWFGHFTCLDTGCVGGSWLTALDVDSLETWQVSIQGHPREHWKAVKKVSRFIARFAKRRR
jgi:serine/threonine protein phosphatase 1